MRKKTFIINKDNPTISKIERIDSSKPSFDEKWLQEILAKHPDILPTNDIEPLFWPIALLAKELKLDTGFMDILFVSSSGYPIIVETKLWKNPEAKREVAAQVLDMAFSLSKLDYDSLDNQVKTFQKKFFEKELTIKGIFEKSFGDENIDYYDFRNKFESNLNAGKFLVLIIADKIHPSTKELFQELNKYPGLGLALAIIELEFYNLSNDSLLVIPNIPKKTEIIERTVVEVKIFNDKEPVISIAQQKNEKDSKSRITLTENEFYNKLKSNVPEYYDTIYQFIMKYKNNPSLEMDPGTNGLRFRKVLPDHERNISLFFITTDSSINVPLQAPRKQFEALNLEGKIIEKFDQKIKKVLNGYKAKFYDININDFDDVMTLFIEDIDKVTNYS